MGGTFFPTSNYQDYDSLTTLSHVFGDEARSEECVDIKKPFYKLFPFRPEEYSVLFNIS